jgi:hypothetical protein
MLLPSRIAPYRTSPEYLWRLLRAIVLATGDRGGDDGDRETSSREELENWVGIILAIGFFVGALSLLALADHFSLAVLLH